ncbi:MAG: uracil-DNA glycosylase [Actinomycetaceae bacterium]|nr:uracil-DNA glycosylase [Actinomycetaceae bacterium]
MEHDYPPLDSVIDPQWARALAPVEPTIHRLGAMLREEAAAGHGYLPAGSDVLRAFTYPMDEVKVLLVGQDPYPTPGHAMGLSFSVKPGVAFPKSLINIFKELCSDTGAQWPSSGDLTPWSHQGVMLLNRVLSVRPGQPQSHQNQGWEDVTSCAIDALVARKKPLVAILWGAAARNLRPQLGDTPVVESPHPSPLSAHRGFFGSRPFSRTNELLQGMGAEPIDWALP